MLKASTVGVRLLGKCKTTGKDDYDISLTLLLLSMVALLRLCLSREDGVPLILAAAAAETADAALTGVIPLAGTLAPLRTGELGGRCLSMYSGEM